MVQDELLRLAVRFQAGSLLAFESALAFDAALNDPARKTWLRLVTALAKYLTAEYAITSCRTALELIGGNGYTSDYPIARLYRDAQVLTVWEGPANIQALELLRLLASKYGGAHEYQQRIRDVIQHLPDALAARLKHRLDGDLAAIGVTTRDRASSVQYARKLLHRLSESLAFALLCEVAALSGDPLHVLAAVRYSEDIDPPQIGSENQQVAETGLNLIDRIAEEDAHLPTTD